MSTEPPSIAADPGVRALRRSALVVATMAFFVGGAPMTRAVQAPFMHALHLGFAIYALLCVGGVFASLARGNVRPAPRP